MEYADIVLLAALLQFVYFTFLVGGARGKTGVKAPACSGHEEFERRFRIQQNTMEQLIVFVPSMFLFSYYLNPLWAAILGVVFIIGRFVYASAYLKDPAKRAPGMLMTFIPNVLLLLGAIAGAIMNLLGN